MKKLFIIMMAVAAILFTVNSCKKTGDSVNPLSDVKNLGVGSYLTLDSNINLNFDYSKIATSAVGILASQYPGGEAVDRIIVYAALGNTYDTTKWKLVKTVSYAGKGTKISVTGAELGTAFGVNPTTFGTGSYYTFYNRIITKTGRKFDVNNTGNNSGSGLVTGPYYYSAFTFTAYIVCPFVGPIAGNYKVIADDWGDWGLGEIVKVLDGPGANQVNLSLVYPGVPAGGTLINPLIVNVDPATGTATIPKVIYGRYGGPTSTQYSGQGANANFNAGYVFSCTGFITLSIDHQGGGTDYGPFRLILQKQ